MPKPPLVRWQHPKIYRSTTSSAHWTKSSLYFGVSSNRIYNPKSLSSCPAASRFASFTKPFARCIPVSPSFTCMASKNRLRASTCITNLPHPNIQCCLRPILLHAGWIFRQWIGSCRLTLRKTQRPIFTGSVEPHDMKVRVRASSF